MYEFESKVRYSEIDHRGTMSLPALINYFQDCSTFHSENIGLGLERLKKEERAWFLSYWQIIIDRYPAMGEKIAVGTFASGFKGMFGNRNFYMKDGQGEIVAKAHSVWVFMDTGKGRPARPPKEHTEPYGQYEPLDMPYEDRKIRQPENRKELEPFPVRRYHIDTNEHVNNCQYVQMALEFLPAETYIRQLRAEYKKSAILGDIICPTLSEEEDRTVIGLYGEDQTPYAIVEIKQ